MVCFLSLAAYDLCLFLFSHLFSHFFVLICASRYWVVYESSPCSCLIVGRPPLPPWLLAFVLGGVFAFLASDN